MTSALGERLAREIRRRGPIDMAELMTLALHHPTEGYYATKDPLGAAGDFTTAPEISQVFGELIGLALAQSWLDRGRPAPCHLIELGPGRGTLMADALRASATVPGFLGCIRLHLVETSPALKAHQLSILGEHGPIWHEDIQDLPEDGPLLIVANEFLDALPIHQYVRQSGRWLERCVGVDEQGALGLVAEPRPGLASSGLLPAAPEGTVLELSPARDALVEELARRLARQGGLALLIDYGRMGPVGDSLQAVQRHRKVDLLHEPGECDLSSHVDFAAVAAAVVRAGCPAYGLIDQALFLERLGLSTRRAKLMRNRSEAEVLVIEEAIDRLIDPLGMGELFKVLALGTGPVPPGFLGQEGTDP